MSSLLNPNNNRSIDSKRWTLDTQERLVTLQKEEIFLTQFAQRGIMIYGYKHCDYELVSHRLQFQNVRIYDSGLGDDQEVSKYSQRSDGTKIYQIKSGKNAKDSHVPQEISRPCKAALVNIVLENYKLMYMKTEFIPIVFCIDITNNPYKVNCENILSKTKICLDKEGFSFQMNSLITHKELRRAYKLCFDPEIPSSIRVVARKTIQFAKVVSSVTTQQNKELTAVNHFLKPFQLQLESIPAPWEMPDWKAHWIERMYQTLPNPPAKECDWRMEIRKRQQLPMK